MYWSNDTWKALSRSMKIVWRYLNQAVAAMRHRDFSTYAGRGLLVTFTARFKNARISISCTTAERFTLVFWFVQHDMVTVNQLNSCNIHPVNKAFEVMQLDNAATFIAQQDEIRLRCEIANRRYKVLLFALRLMKTSNSKIKNVEVQWV